MTAAVGESALALTALFTLIGPAVMGLIDLVDAANSTNTTAGKIDIGADVLEISQIPAEYYAWYYLKRDPTAYKTNTATISMCAVIAFGLLTITILEHINKPSPSNDEPDSGDAFRNGAAQFEEIRSSLPASKPAEWSGPAATDLTARIAAQQDRAALVAQADVLLADTTDTQARQVAFKRNLVAGAKITLAAAIPGAVALWNTVSSTASLRWQLTCTVGAVIEVVVAYTMLVEDGHKTSDNAQKATAIYQQVYEDATAAVPPDWGLIEPQTAAALISTDDCDGSPVAANMSDRSRPAASTNPSEHDRPVVRAPARHGLTMRTVNEQAPQYVNLVTPTASPRQQPATKQKPPTEKAPQPTARTQDIDGVTAGAAPGPESAQRIPEPTNDQAVSTPTGRPYGVRDRRGSNNPMG